MERNIERQIVPQIFSPRSHVRLSNYPVGDLVNTSVGGAYNVFDFYMPVSSGRANASEVKKQLAPVPGPSGETPDDPDTKKVPGVPVANMAGFGIKPEPSETAKIMEAMSRPVIKINRLSTSPSKSVTKKSKKLKPHKFNFV
jgi:hypothetical protein